MFGRYLAAFVTILLLAACGGGGDGKPVVQTPQQEIYARADHLVYTDIMWKTSLGSNRTTRVFCNGPTCDGGDFGTFTIGDPLEDSDDIRDVERRRWTGKHAVFSVEKGRVRNAAGT